MFSEYSEIKAVTNNRQQESLQIFKHQIYFSITNGSKKKSQGKFLKMN
jgi:hypothetical protein